MRFLFDQNISHRILQFLPVEYKDSTTAKQEGLINAPDRKVWEYAKDNDYVIVTHDSDFNDLSLLFGFPPKIIWIRTGNLSTRAILDILIDHSTEIEKFLSDSSYGCFEIISLKKI
jgi:predicted nuclease of predicted toxin-antitoxin system